MYFLSFNDSVVLLSVWKEDCKYLKADVV